MTLTLKIIIFISLAFVISCVASPPDVVRLHRYDWEKDVGFTQIVRVGNLIYLSGTVSYGDTMEEQVHGVYQSIQNQLAEFGLDTSAIVKEVAYTTDIESLKNVIPVRKTYFSEDHYPSATWVQVERLFMEAFMLEVEIVAVVK